MGKALPYLALVLSAAFFGGTWVAARGVETDVPPIALAFLRWLVAALVLLPIFVGQVRRLWPTVRAEAWTLVQAAAIGMAGFTALIFIGLRSTTAINGALINAATPVFIMLLSLVGIGETSTRRQVAGAAIALLGLVSVVTSGEPARLMTLDLNPGDVWILLAMFGWALYSIMLKTRPSALPPFIYLTVTVTLAAALLAPLFLIEMVAGQTVSPTPRAISAILYLGLFTSLGAFLCWNYGVRRVGAAPASLFTYLIPVFAALFAVLMLDERLELFHLVGAALIIAGIGIANLPVRRREGA